MTSSTAEWAGVTARIPAFWSQALTSQSAASAAGWVPPMTKPKKRPDGIAVSPSLAGPGQQVDHLDRVGRTVGQLGAEQGGHVVGRSPRAAPVGPSRDSSQVDGVLVGAVQRGCARLVWHLTPRSGMRQVGWTAQCRDTR